MTFDVKNQVSIKYRNMKKIILAIVAATFMVNISRAQEGSMDLRDNLTLGIKIGANLSKVYDTQAQDFNADGKFGLATGVFVGIPISKYLGLQPELLYSQKGFKATGGVSVSAYEFTHTLNYLDLPLFLTVKPSPMITLLAGPQYSYLLKEKYDFKNQLITGGFENNDARKSNFCLVGGLDINLNNLVISGRAGWDLNETDKNGTTTTPRYKNVWFQATIGFRY